jgi:hypothetical protein
MPDLLLDDIKRTASALDGQRLETLHRRKPFRLQVEDKGFRYTPESGKSRLQQWKYIQNVLDRFNEIRSFSPGDYKNLTMNAAYLLVIIHIRNGDSTTANI